MNGMDKVSGKPLADFSHLQQSIMDILSTPIGSRPMRRDYGSRLFQRLDAPLTGDLVAEIYSDVVEALFNYEPRIKVTAVTVTELIPGKIVLTLDGVYIPTGEIININGITIQ